MREDARLVGHRGAALSCALAGRFVLTCGEDRTVRLWNPARADAGGTCSPVHTFEGHHGYELWDVCATAHHDRVACCGRDRCAFVWDVAQSRLVRRLEGHAERLSAVCFAGTSEQLVLSASHDRTVRAFDLRAAPRHGAVQVLSGFRDNVTCVRAAEGPASPRLVAASADGCVRSFDVRQGRCLEDALGAPVSWLALSGAGQPTALAACLGAPLALLDLDSGALLAAYRGHRNAENRTPCAFGGPADALAVAGCETGNLLFWDLATGALLKTLAAHRSPVAALACDAHTLVSCSYDGAAVVRVLL